MSLRKAKLKAGGPMELSLKSLTGIALQNWGSDRSWEAIAKLQVRGSPESLAIAHGFAKSRNWRKRALGLYIASQLCKRQKRAQVRSIEYALEETQAMLLSGLQDRREEVICAAISGLGHRPHPLALPVMIKFATHSNQQIRFQVAVALGRYSEPESIETLLRLATDSVDEVRNWATFSIGTMHEADSPEIRAMLWTNLQDQSEDVRGEALVGLARRKDERIVPVLHELLDANCRVFELMASELIASPQLLECLNKIKNSVADEGATDSYWYLHLIDAIQACSTQRE